MFVWYNNRHRIVFNHSVQNHNQICNHTKVTTKATPPPFPVQQMNTIGIAFLPHFVALTLLQSCNHLDQNHSCAPDTIPSTSLTLTSPSGYSFLHDCARTKVQSNIRFIFLIAPRRENSAISSPPPRLKTHPKEMLSSHPPPPTTIT